MELTLVSTVVPTWPKLAWVARHELSSATVEVLHGPCVEAHDTWCVEAVWGGAFEDGDFDQTDLIVGTGVRVRGAEVVFVSSGDTLNRLYWLQDEGTLVVSNSLPALLASADAALVEDYDYARAMASIVEGLAHYEREVPTTKGGVCVGYLDNVHVVGDRVSLIPKPSGTPDFDQFEVYRAFLFASARSLGRNASSPQRRHPVTTRATISSGYDSPAAAVLAKEAGADRAFTIARGRRDLANLFDADDSGGVVARQLGLACTTHDRRRVDYPFEDAAWAVMGNVGDINLSLFEYPGPLCLLFTGFMGDVLWDRNTVQPSFLHRKDTSGARFSESRLEHGVLLCSPVFWGCRREAQILALAHLPEMKPWTLGSRYDRPVPRRLLEEAGVARGAFARRKRAASFNRRYGRPLSPALRNDFSGFMRRRGHRPGSAFGEMVGYVADAIDYYLLQGPPTGSRSSVPTWPQLPSATDFFLWANERRVRRYFAGLEQAGHGHGGPAEGFAHPVGWSSA